MCLNSVATTTTGELSTVVPVSVMVSSYLTMSRPGERDTIYQREGEERERETDLHRLQVLPKRQISYEGGHCILRSLEECLEL